MGLPVAADLETVNQLITTYSHMKAVERGRGGGGLENECWRRGCNPMQAGGCYLLEPTWFGGYSLLANNYNNDGEANNQAGENE